MEIYKIFDECRRAIRRRQVPLRGGAVERTRRGEGQIGGKTCSPLPAVSDPAARRLIITAYYPHAAASWKQAPSQDPKSGSRRRPSVPEGGVWLTHDYQRSGYVALVLVACVKVRKAK
jgi:hypothetical protein